MFFNSGSTIEGDYVILTPTAKVTSGIDFVPPLSSLGRGRYNSTGVGSNPGWAAKNSSHSSPTQH